MTGHHWTRPPVAETARRCEVCDELAKVVGIERGRQHVRVHWRCRAGCDVAWTETTEPDTEPKEDADDDE